MLYGEKLSCTAKPSRNFIINHKYTISVTEFSQPFQVERRIYTHPCGSLQNRLHNHRHRFLSMSSKCLFCASETFHITGFPGLSIRTAEAIQPLQMDVMHHHGLINPGIQIHTAYGKRPDGFPMIRACQAHKPGPLRLPCLLLILKGHLERTLHS